MDLATGISGRGYAQKRLLIKELEGNQFLNQYCSKES